MFLVGWLVIVCIASCVKVTNSGELVCCVDRKVFMEEVSVTHDEPVVDSTNGNFSQAPS